MHFFFVILAFNFIEFSTNIATARTFIVSKIEVEEKYNLNFNKLKIIDRGFRKAFEDLTQMILERKDHKKITNTSIEDIKKIVESFSILDEKCMIVRFCEYPLINPLCYLKQKIL